MVKSTMRRSCDSLSLVAHISHLISDSRSQAVVDATAAYLNGAVTGERAALIYAEWDNAHQSGQIDDLAGGLTNDAIESVFGLGYGNAAQVATAGIESVGHAASNSLQPGDADFALAWNAGKLAEREWQCKLLRELFGYRS
jgi:hypothetical protein